jgi:hypothetical protein
MTHTGQAVPVRDDGRWDDTEQAANMGTWSGRQAVPVRDDGRWDDTEQAANIGTWSGRQAVPVRDEGRWGNTEQAASTPVYEVSHGSSEYHFPQFEAGLST